MKNNNFLYTQSAKIFQENVAYSDIIFPAHVDICITKIPIRQIDGYSEEFIMAFADKLSACISPNGMIFLICYAPTECKYRSFEVSKIMTDKGFHHVDNIIVEKTWVSGRKIDNMLLNSHEYALVFSKSKDWVMDKRALELFFGIEGSDFLGNCWVFESGLLSQSIPIPLAEALMRMVQCLPGALVMDPFMSNESTLKVALKLGYSFWGCEKDKNRMKDYENIISKHKEEIGLYEFIKEAE